jgi:hypothetical protein
MRLSKRRTTVVHPMANCCRMGRTNWFARNCSHDVTLYAPISCMWPSMIPVFTVLFGNESVKQRGYCILMVFAQSECIVMSRLFRTRRIIKMCCACFVCTCSVLIGHGTGIFDMQRVRKGTRIMAVPVCFLRVVHGLGGQDLRFSVQRHGSRCFSDRTAVAAICREVQTPCQNHYGQSAVCVICVFRSLSLSLTQTPFL